MHSCPRAAQTDITLSIFVAVINKFDTPPMPRLDQVMHVVRPPPPKQARRVLIDDDVVEVIQDRNPTAAAGALFTIHYAFVWEFVQQV